MRNLKIEIIEPQYGQTTEIVLGSDGYYSVLLNDPDGDRQEFRGVSMRNGSFDLVGEKKYYPTRDNDRLTLNLTTGLGTLVKHPSSSRGLTMFLNFTLRVIED